MNEDVEDGYIFADAALAASKEGPRETEEDLLVLRLSSSFPDQRLLHDLVMLPSPFYQKGDETKEPSIDLHSYKFSRNFEKQQHAAVDNYFLSQQRIFLSSRAS